MSILVLNAGSSSLRFTLFSNTLKESYKGHVDGIGNKHCRFRNYTAKGNVEIPLKIKNHQEAITFALKKLREEKLIVSIKDIQKVAHRVVHGGEKYKDPTRITPPILKALDRLSTLAPLHNPSNVRTIRAAQKSLPTSKHYAIFDTAFHATLPEAAYLYGLPYSVYKKEGIRRYGFHGTSHKYVSLEAAQWLKSNRSRPTKKPLSLITCHMGNGISIAAIRNGKSLDTTMGFTPLEGPIMGTRSGTLDPGILLHLLKKYTPKKLAALLQHESGLKGLSGLSSDIRDLHSNPTAPGTKRAFRVLAYQMAKYIMSLTAALGELPDALIFSAGIGEHAPYLRAQILEHLKGFGIELNPSANKKASQEGATKSFSISTARSTVKVLVIPTNEELQMAREIHDL